MPTPSTREVEPAATPPERGAGPGARRGAARLAGLLWAGFGLVLCGGALVAVAAGWIHAAGPMLAAGFWAWAGAIFVAAGWRTLRPRGPASEVGLRLRWDAIGSIGFALLLIACDWLYYGLELRASVDHTLHQVLVAPIVAGLLALHATRSAGTAPPDDPTPPAA